MTSPEVTVVDLLERDVKRIREAFAEQKRERGLTLMKLLDLVGGVPSYGSIRRILDPERTQAPNPIHVMRLCAVLGIPMDYAAGAEEEAAAEEEVEGLGELGENLVARLNAERKRQELSMDALAARTEGEVSGAMVWRMLEGGGEAEPAALLALARALGRSADWLVNPELEDDVNEWGVVGHGELPIVAVGQARTGNEILFEPLDPPYEMENLKGLVLGTVLDDSLLDLAGEGQRVMLDPNLHPDDAPPHKDFHDPIALVRYRDRDGDEHWVYKRWHRLSKHKVRLITVRKDRLGPDGFPEHFDMRDNRIVQAWTVRGVLW